MLFRSVLLVEFLEEQFPHNKGNQRHKEQPQHHFLYRTIGKAVKMCENTVRKYVLSLEEKGLIRTEPTTITTKDGRIRNGSLLYTIRPIQEALEIFYQRQLTRADEEAEKARLRKRLAQLNEQKSINETEGASA